jgi:hypothetical protein
MCVCVCVRFYDPRYVNVKITDIWDLLPYIFVEICQFLRKICWLHDQVPLKENEVAFETSELFQ